MVLKPVPLLYGTCKVFESDVISDGTQASNPSKIYKKWFESDVISDGTQASTKTSGKGIKFESDVISDGTQADISISSSPYSLRVM